MRITHLKTCLQTEKETSLNVAQHIRAVGADIISNSLFEMFQSCEFHRINPRFQISPNSEIPNPCAHATVGLRQMRLFVTFLGDGATLWTYCSYQNELFLLRTQTQLSSHSEHTKRQLLYHGMEFWACSMDFLRSGFSCRMPIQLKPTWKRYQLGINSPTCNGWRCQLEVWSPATPSQSFHVHWSQSSYHNIRS
jgi:hypothetical protein